MSIFYFRPSKVKETFSFWKGFYFSDYTLMDLFLFHYQFVVKSLTVLACLLQDVQ